MTTLNFGVIIIIRRYLVCLPLMGKVDVSYCPVKPQNGDKQLKNCLQPVLPALGFFTRSGFFGFRLGIWVFFSEICTNLGIFTIFRNFLYFLSIFSISLSIFSIF